MTDTKTKEQSGSEFIIHRESNGNERIVTVIREYDPMYPIDSATGKPPLTKEFTQTVIKNKNKKTEASGKEDRQSEKLEFSHTEKDTRKAVQMSTEQKKGLSSLQNLLCCLGGILLSAIAGCLLYKAIKKRAKTN